jgi:kynureninase
VLAVTDSLLRFRERFPIFSERNYLASQCLGPFPAEGYGDLEEFLRQRHLHNRMLGMWLERCDELTHLIEELLNAPSGSVALRDSATACQAAIAAAVEPRGERRRIIVTEMDFHSSLHLWSAQARRGFELVQVKSPDGIHLPAEAIVREIDERTAVVAVGLVLRNSALLDVSPVIAAARQSGAVSILDAYQAVGVHPVDVRALGADVVVGGNHKWLSGETGVAFLYVRPELDLQPAYPGWFGHSDFANFVHAHTFQDQFSPMEGARRFQQGTPAVMPIYAARAGLRFVLEAGVANIAARNAELLRYLHDGCDELKLPVLTPKSSRERAGGLCLGVPDPEGVVRKLAEQGIDVDQRRRKFVRVAPHACTTIDECAQLLQALARILRQR